MLALLVILASMGPVSAQSGEDLQSELQEIAAYAEQARPIVESIYGLIEITDAADLDFLSFESGEITEQEYRQRLATHSNRIEVMAVNIRARFKALPSAPEFSLQDIQVGFGEGQFESLVHSNEVFAQDVIALYERLIEADDEDIKAFSMSVYDRADVMISVTNTIIQSSIDSLGNEPHPQRHALGSVINANHAMLRLLQVQKALIYPEETDGLDAALSAFKATIPKHRNLLRQGKSDQASTREQLVRSRIFLSGPDRDFTDRAIAMLDAYDQQWALEQQMIDWMEGIASELDAANADYEDLDAILMRAMDEFVPFEDRRTELIYGRVSLLK